MHIVSNRPWKVVVYDSVYICNIEATGCEVSCDEYCSHSTFESGEIGNSLTVLHEGMELSGREL